MSNIKIIYDKNDTNKRRTCFWDLPEFPEICKKGNNFEFISIGDYLDEKSIDENLIAKKSTVKKSTDKKSIDTKLNSLLLLNLFDRSQTDIIILNWDSINDDPIYGSNKTFNFFNHYKPDLSKWVKNGGIIIVEAQTAAWQLNQKSYDIFSNDIITTKIRKRGISVQINNSVLTHPVLRGLNNEIDLPSTGLFQKPWFPTCSNVCSISNTNNESNRKRLYQGWFECYPKNWVPLMFINEDTDDKVIIYRVKKLLRYANYYLKCFKNKSYVNMKDIFKFSIDHTKKPVMLCNIVSNKDDSGGDTVGAYIITTMYIGASSLDQLVINLLNLPNNIKKYYDDNEKTLREKRQRKKILYVFVVFILLIAIYFNYKKVFLLDPLNKSSVLTSIITTYIPNNYTLTSNHVSMFIALVSMFIAFIILLVGDGVLPQIWKFLKRI